MAEARRCDRCNEFYSINDINEKRGEYPITTTYKKSVGSMTLYDNNVSRIKHLDLCPRCSKSLIVWLNDYGQYDVAEETEKSEVKKIDVRDNTICKTCKFHSIPIFEKPCCVCDNYDMYSAQVAIAKAEEVLKNVLNVVEVKDCKHCKYDELYDNAFTENDPCNSCDNFDNFEPKEDKE